MKATRMNRPRMKPPSPQCSMGSMPRGINVPMINPGDKSPWYFPLPSHICFKIFFCVCVQVTTHINEALINTEIRSVPATRHGLYFAFYDQGACTTLLSARVYFIMCPATITSFATFPNTPTGAEVTIIYCYNYYLSFCVLKILLEIRIIIVTERCYYYRSSFCYISLAALVLLITIPELLSAGQRQLLFVFLLLFFWNYYFINSCPQTKLELITQS